MKSGASQTFHFNQCLAEKQEMKKSTRKGFQFFGHPPLRSRVSTIKFGMSHRLSKLKVFGKTFSTFWNSGPRIYVYYYYYLLILWIHSHSGLNIDVEITYNINLLRTVALDSFNLFWQYL